MAQFNKTQESVNQCFKCNFCNGLIQQAVTVIPCGHNYCQKCENGYKGKCNTCGPKVKIEAVYKNELMDEILSVFQQISGLVPLFQKENLETILK